MKLVITCYIDPGDQDLAEIRARIKGHASVIRELVRDGTNTTGVGLESYVLAKYGSDNNPRLKRIDLRVEG